MNVTELLAELSQRNVKLSVDSGQLNIRAPKGVLTKELRDSLTESKAEILAFLQAANASTTPQLVTIERTDTLSLSLTQERLWQLEKLLSDNSSHNLPVAFRIKGNLDVAVLEKAIAQIVSRHEVLRASFIEKDGEAVSVIASDLDWHLPVIDLQDLPPAEREEKAKAIAQAAAKHQFKLSEAPIWFAKVVCLAPDDRVLILVMHHIVSDGWSLSVFLKEVGAIYEALLAGKSSPLPALPVQYVDFAAWQRRSLTDEFLSPQLDRWQELLEGELVPLQLPTDRPQSASQTYKGGHYEFNFPADLTQDIKAFTAKEGITLYVLLLAGYQALLHLYTGQEDLIVSSPIAGRNQPEIEGAIGYFNNILPMRAKIAANMTFKELLQQIGKYTSVAYANQDVPFQKLATLPNMMRTPLSRGLLALQPPPGEALKLSGLAVSPLHIYRETIDFDLPLFLEDRGENIGGTAYYKIDLFDSSTIAKLVADYQDLLAKVVANPDVEISSLPKYGSDRDFSSSQEAEKPEFVAPRDEIEIKLATIWEKTLKVQPIGIKDHFFNNLGGSSILAVSLFAQIEKTFQKNLPLAALIQAPTIEQLAGIIRQEKASSSWSCLVPIQPLGSKPPIFFIHAKGGNILTYVDVARYLGSDQPVYGLQALGIDGKGKYHSSLEEMASHYLEEIISFQPQGPYYLGGLSGGGVIAFEIAQRLIDKGQNVAFLGLFDTYNSEYGLERALADKKYREIRSKQLGFILEKNLPYRRLVQNWNRMLRVFRQFINLKGKERSDLLAIKFERFKDSFSKKLDMLAYKLNPQRDAPLPYPLREDAINKVIIKSVRNYVTRPYPGKITLFRADATIYITEDGPDNDEVGWTKFAKGGLEIHKVSGEHNTVLAEPHVRTLAPILIRCLNEAQKLEA